MSTSTATGASPKVFAVIMPFVALLIVLLLSQTLLYQRLDSWLTDQQQYRVADEHEFDDAIFLDIDDGTDEGKCEGDREEHQDVSESVEERFEPDVDTSSLSDPVLYPLQGTGHHRYDEPVALPEYEITVGNDHTPLSYHGSQECVPLELRCLFQFSTDEL